MESTPTRCFCDCCVPPCCPLNFGSWKSSMLGRTMIFNISVLRAFTTIFAMRGIFATFPTIALVTFRRNNMIHGPGYPDPLITCIAKCGVNIDLAGRLTFKCKPHPAGGWGGNAHHSAPVEPCDTCCDHYWHRQAVAHHFNCNPNGYRKREASMVYKIS